ncbi:SH3 domain-containing protein [Methylotenera mobilis]|uniref:SH3 type 3 domain protein n=1 Tax=Methylotenera mobilis (strain JLW8 / ATCC BAA-1282 / DSM 17540) TaxID=583345 RepID=C6WVH5_METML|nr:SH3 domain-containing protein [Methylotenera mobilis]ACT47924.1 SH3 type 3 domain protein [Methylotenera mobilis JLW8]
MKHYLKQALLLSSLVPLLYAGISVAAEKGSALKNDSLRNEPFADAKVTGSFARGENLEIIKKQGAWLQVKAAKGSGWVRLLSVKRGTATKSNQAAGVLAVASGRAGTGQVVSTTGVRGLSEQELKAAKFNEEEVKTMESYTLSADKGRAFAKAGNLNSIAFKNLKEVKGGTQ